MKRSFPYASSCPGGLNASNMVVYTAVAAADVAAAGSTTFTILPEENFVATHLWVSSAKDLTAAGFNDSGAGTITSLRKGRINLLSNFTAGEGIPAEMASPLPLGLLNIDPAVGLAVEYTNGNASVAAVSMGLIGHTAKSGMYKDSPAVYISTAPQDIAAAGTGDFSITPTYEVAVSHLIVSAGYDIATTAPTNEAIYGCTLSAITRGRDDFLSAPNATDAIPAVMASVGRGLTQWGLPLGKVLLDSNTTLDFTVTNRNADAVRVSAAAVCLRK